jgi:hypothetical protein
MKKVMLKRLMNIWESLADIGTIPGLTIRTAAGRAVTCDPGDGISKPSDLKPIGYG